ncbi:MAG: hypothetical protein JXQ76_03325 [Campylobacterales bacterium]|nr:hypothetical protein [Campylobacterales bacterium]
MTNQEIVDAIKAQYDRNTRKELIKTIQKLEKSKDYTKLQGGYQILHQIFSYILKELSWDINDRTLAWNQDPLEILTQSLPQIEQTQWFTGLAMTIQAHIDGKEGFEKVMRGIVQTLK